MDRWYKIDHAGKIFRAVAKGANTSVFRVSMIMNEPVNAKRLQEAVDLVIKRFPTLAVELHQGVFWDFLSANENKLFIQKETKFPCYRIDAASNNGYLVRVLYFHRRISVEIFHSLTDGTGAVEFLKTLVYQYLCLLGKNIEGEGLIMLPNEMPSNYEIEDSFKKYYQHVGSKRLKEPKAFHIKGTPFEPVGNNVIHGVVSASQLYRAAKQNNQTITEYLTSILLYAIYSQMMKYETIHNPIKIAIPVNLRNMFPSKTMRNFFTVVNVGMNVSNKPTFESLAKEVSVQLKEKTKKEYLYEGIARNIKYEKILAARFVPVFIKYIAMRHGFESFGENLKTITVSNLGNIKLPESMRKYIDSMEAVLYPTEKSPINCGICTVNDRLTITFSRSIVEADIIRYFFHFLTKRAGIDISVYSNNWGQSR
ncbi:alcohol acetyltransferase [Bacillus chungangensis]|uniref:NRPS condensation-like uncharacterized protein n=1 Tax=Bacillus chungangensis TaxID=587633 RepID=A0ABT9WNV8_9BACI|nr:alcohol acetyltransferase [Bacillus chungangensis]MDQ0174929.1 NRPS condensation-like uncharacterized protein [Bacillus chungangensis]